MMSLLLFVGTAVILIVEGRLLMRILGRKHCTTAEEWLLGFPLGAFLNALLFYVCMLIGLPLSGSVIFFAHLLILLLLGGAAWRERKQTECVSMMPSVLSVFRRMSPWVKVLLIVLILSLSVKVFYGISHAVFFPTYYFDSLSQWTMRSQISFLDQAIAFDLDEVRGISKPQYPILFHSLQIFFMLPQREWIDAVANSSTLLLSLSTLLAFFFLLRRRGGLLFSVLTLALLLMIPLVPFHVVQGYGDIHVIEYILLSAFFLLLFFERRDRHLLLLSALFVAASAWVKQEGLFLGVLPWLFITGIWIIKNSNDRKAVMLFGWLPAAVFGSLWTFFLLFRGMHISPHGKIASLEWHSEGLPHVLNALFSSGSFGIFWYVLPLLLFVTLVSLWKEREKHLPTLFIVAWGVITFLQALYVFLLTPNVQFLLNGQTFHRTMLIPLFLLILSSMLLLQPVIRSSEEKR